MFYLKEVAPLPGKSDLWSTFVPKAREFNVAVNKGEIKEDALKEEIKRRASAKRNKPRRLVRENAMQTNRRGLQFDGSTGGFIFGKRDDNKVKLVKELGVLFGDDDETEGLVV